MYVAELWRYPVKSMAGERLADAELRLDGIPGDRALCVVDEDGEILSARTKPLLLGHHATVDERGDVLVDGQPWDSPEVTAAVQAGAGPGARIVPASGPERFDILPLLVATDGAIQAFGYDRRRRDEERRPAPARPQTAGGGQERSVGGPKDRTSDPRRTIASSWRSTTISSSLNCSERQRNKTSSMSLRTAR